MVDYSKFEKALRHLDAQFSNYLTLSDDLPVLLQEAVAESVVQRFEVCYDCLWKVLKRHLMQEMGLPDIPNSPKPVFRIAFENGLFAQVDPWLVFADARVGTAHDYSGEKAKQALALMGNFIEHSKYLYEKISGQKWV